MARTPIIDLDKYFNEVTFNKKWHKYYVKGKEYTSCTTFLNKIKTDTFTEAFKERYAKKHGLEVSYITDLWDIKREVGCLRGTETHFIIESYYKYGFIPEYSDLVTKEATQFKKFLKDNKNLEPIKIEWIVYDCDIEIAGTLDMLFLNKDTGKYELYDWKTNKEIKLKGDCNFIYPLDYLNQSDINIYSLQLSVYKTIIEKNTTLKIDKLYMVHFCKNNENYKRYELNYKAEEMSKLGFIKEFDKPSLL